MHDYSVARVLARPFLLLSSLLFASIYKTDFNSQFLLLLLTFLLLLFIMSCKSSVLSYFVLGIVIVVLQLVRQSEE